ncbi:Protein YrdA [hydrothermal vent metagenome]|uniref:Protein YrdA n=1 Tax=hydrothermal vent metagenome TaxID=652676 RepID=A0A3B0Z3E0_9ZZZZ
MSTREYKSIKPDIGERVYIDQQACVVGDVKLGDDSSIWPMAVVRGDVNSITIGARSNIQDGSVLHVTHRYPDLPDGHSLTIGDEVTIGHQVILHGCTIHSQVLVGMGSLILDGAILEPNVLLGAGSLVAESKVLEGGYLWLGRPARKIRALTEDEISSFHYSANHYVHLKDDYLGS